MIWLMNLTVDMIIEGLSYIEVMMTAPDFGGAGPRHVHVFSHMYDMTVALSHFYQRGKFVCRHLNYRSSSRQYSLVYYLIL